MRPEERDPAYLWDMNEAARSVREFMSGVAAQRYQSDKMLRSAVERQIEIIGEAAAHISAEFRARHPQVPWQKIIGQRNVLAHEYGEILDERIYQLAVRDIPELLVMLEAIITDVRP